MRPLSATVAVVSLPTPHRAVARRNIRDFTCFLNAFAAGATYANCDHSTTAPILNVLDFTCFLNAFAAGCP